MFKLYLFHRPKEYEADDKNHPCPKGFGWRAYSYACPKRQAGAVKQRFADPKRAA